MDTQLSEIKECVARVEERVITILKNQEKQDKALQNHEARDREDFKEVRSRIIKVEGRQNKAIGIGATVMFVVGPFLAFFKDITKFFGG